MVKHDIICLHTMVGSLSSTDNFFHQDGYGGTESHFGVGYDGLVYQWQDTERQADANLDGNDRVLSIETADSGPGFPIWSGSNVPAWLPAQIEAIARIVAWGCDTYHIPCQLIPDSGQSRRGIGYHRQGIDPWRCNTCERWSTSTGKVCPGDRRVNQVPQVIARANAILNGDDVTEAEMDQLLSKMWAKNVQVGDSVEAFQLAVGRTRNALQNKPTTELSTEHVDLAAKVDALAVQVDGIVLGGLDYDLLAQKVVEKLTTTTELAFRPAT